jgi:heme/copper-type cytochrome/quinol oxidase subunit 4
MRSVSRYTFDYAFRALLMILPFMTVLSVFTREKIHLGGVSFIKEFLVILMLGTVAYYHITRKQKIYWNMYDLLIGIYILILGGITLFTTKFSGLVYG